MCVSPKFIRNGVAHFLGTVAVWATPGWRLKMAAANVQECLGVDERADGTRLVRLALYHDQAGVPQYYTATAYLSIAASRLPIEPTEGDEVSIDIETYGGTLTRTFTF